MDSHISQLRYETQKARFVSVATTLTLHLSLLKPKTYTVRQLYNETEVME
jgi:hypothetical protein